MGQPFIFKLGPRFAGCQPNREHHNGNDLANLCWERCFLKKMYGLVISNWKDAICKFGIHVQSKGTSNRFKSNANSWHHTSLLNHRPNPERHQALAIPLDTDGSDRSSAILGNCPAWHLKSILLHCCLWWEWVISLPTLVFIQLFIYGKPAPPLSPSNPDLIPLPKIDALKKKWCLEAIWWMLWDWYSLGSLLFNSWLAGRCCACMASVCSIANHFAIALSVLGERWMLVSTVTLDSTCMKLTVQLLQLCFDQKELSVRPCTWLCQVLFVRRQADNIRATKAGSVHSPWQSWNIILWESSKRRVKCSNLLQGCHKTNWEASRTWGR